MNKRYEELNYLEKKLLLLKASDNYYNSTPIMTDFKFDEFKDKFEEEFPNDPFLKTIGAPIPKTSKWKKTNHSRPMGSLNKTKNIDETNKWIENYWGKFEQCIISEKLDGSSLSLEYIDGKLVKAITRGDGIIGEDITINVLKMQNVKINLGIKYTGALRAEIILTGKDFDSLNKILEERGESRIKNLRNGANGIAKRYDSKYVEYLTVKYYDATGDFEDKLDIFDFLKNCGLKTAFINVCNNINEIEEIYNIYETKDRANLDYDIDGLVIEVNNIKLHSKFGNLNNRPKGAFALKFGSIKKTAKIIDVTWSLGNSGRVTPLIHIEPTKVGGVTIRKMSAHNLDIFKKLNITDGILSFERSNDVIPTPIEMIKNGIKKYIRPINCPVCHSILNVDGAFLICENDDCPGNKIGNIKKWILKTGIKTQGIGDRTIEILYEKGFIQQPSDLYKLDYEKVAELDGFGKRSAELIKNIIESSRELTLQEFLSGLNIKNFSSETANLLIDHGYDTIDKILSININDIINIKGIGLKTAEDLAKGLKKKVYIIYSLLHDGTGINIIVKKKIDGKLSGLSFCFTGAVGKINENTGKTYKREEMERIVIDNGGEVKSVKNGLTYLVQADPESVSSKTKNAQNLGVTIISENKFFEMI